MKEPIKDVRYVCPYCDGRYWSIDREEVVNHIKTCPHNNELPKRNCFKCKFDQPKEAFIRTLNSRNGSVNVSCSNVYSICSYKSNYGPYCAGFQCIPDTINYKE